MATQALPSDVQSKAQTNAQAKAQPTVLAPAPCAVTGLTATELSVAIHSRALSCREVMRRFLDRIDQVNPSFNAIVSQLPRAQALVQADEHDAMLAAGQSKGFLHGMPQAIKDLAHTQGIATTMGSPLMRHFVPQTDGLMAARMKAAGAIVIGKTNVPEFGLGSHTFNTVFGATCNAYNTAKSAGGSSGGAAVALATHMLPVADGSDFMGSLRNPAAWNNVYGLRPTQGLIPMWPAIDVWVSQLGTEGPMARNLADMRQLLAIQAGFDARSPLAMGRLKGASPFQANAIKIVANNAVNVRQSANLAPKNIKIGWLGDLGGHLAMEPGIVGLCEATLARFETAGAVVQPCALGFEPARVWTAWLTWRRWLVAARLAPLLRDPANRMHVKPEALWEHDQAQGLTGEQVMHASAERTAFYQAFMALFDQFDLLALPSAQVWPFDIGTRWPGAIATDNGTQGMDTYHRWMEATIYATFAGAPSLSVPVGFGAVGPGAGLSMGMQLMARPGCDFELLDCASALSA